MPGYIQTRSRSARLLMTVPIATIVLSPGQEAHEMCEPFKAAHAVLGVSPRFDAEGVDAGRSAEAAAHYRGLGGAAE